MKMMHQIGTNHPPIYLGELRNQEEIVVAYGVMPFFVYFPALNNIKLHLSIQKLFKETLLPLSTKEQSEELSLLFSVWIFGKGLY